MSSINVKHINYKRILRAEDYRDVSYNRWNNAVQSFNHNDYFAAVYLAGYSVECILKYVIIKLLLSDEIDKKNGLNLAKLAPKKSHEFFYLKSHKLDKLMELGNQKNVFVTPKQSDFKEVIKWTSEWRYATQHSFNNKTITEDFLKSIVEISQQLKSSLQGKIKLKEFEL